MNGQEAIISGPSTGYSKKYGMSAPEYPADRTFYVRNEQKNELYKLIEHIGIKYVFVAEEAVQYAEKNPEKNLSPSLLLILTDHISNATSRVASGIQTNSVFLDGIKVLCRAEYAISRDALTIIDKQFSVQLPDDETGFIILYILNNCENSADHGSMRVIELSQIITELIKVVYNKKVDRNSFSCPRFMMHLKYFSNRVLRNERIRQKDIGDIYEQPPEKDILLQYTIHEIERYLYATFGYGLTLEEKLYLFIRTKVLMD